MTALKGQTITLDAASANPVTITFAALNGNGVSTTDENDLSLVSVVRFGQFDAVFGGDLSGSGTGTVDPDPADTPNPPNPSCTYAVSPTSSSVISAGGSFSVSITTTAGCAWTATSNASWLTRSPTSGSGNGTVSVSATANSGSARSGSLTIAGQTVTVSQTQGTTGSIPTCAPPPGSPSGATAACNDNTYSFSTNRGGTCSGHSGVRCWICPGALCSGLILGESSKTPQFLDFTPTNRPAAYADIESTVGNVVGKVEVYKVHHHGSKFSSNASWLAATTPKVDAVPIRIPDASEDEKSVGGDGGK